MVSIDPRRGSDSTIGEKRGTSLSKFLSLVYAEDWVYKGKDDSFPLTDNEVDSEILMLLEARNMPHIIDMAGEMTQPSV